MAIAEIQSTGGTLTIEFGDGSSDHTSVVNQLNLAAKQSILFVSQIGAQDYLCWSFCYLCGIDVGQCMVTA